MAGTDGPELALRVGSALERLARVVRQLAQPSDLSFGAVVTLSTLERLGPHRLTDLAAREGVTQPAMTQLVTRLADAGLVARATDPTDGRVVRVHLTEAGRATLAARRAKRVERVAGLLAELSPQERAALSAALPAVDALVDLASGERTPAQQETPAQQTTPARRATPAGE
ncbi:MarR family transcriptional regulator [Frankia sp. AvcI1]|uniref:MarR family winged helix-turn-helix transcriptional regulator n=1 Tax=Frankia sp. AvcI1 TaxID=573496 RepID=UPI002117A5FB|nr:MarR family transcriptional regulator [Frankia sp. AvcI1]